MDRLTHAEVGGPYASHEDAERAILRGGFDQAPAELLVSEGNGDDGGDTSREARRTAAWGPFETPVSDATPSPATPQVPELRDPMPAQNVMPKTTKPSQVPGGSAGLPQDPASPQFDAGAGQTVGADPDPLGSATASVVAEIRAANPGIDDETLIRVASRTVARLVEADFDPLSMGPRIEDPLANRTPWQLVQDVRRAFPRHPITDPTRRVQDWAERRWRQRRPDLWFGEEEGGQRTLFPEPPRQPSRSQPQPEPEAEAPEGPMQGQQRLFDDPDEVPDPPTPPAAPARRRRRPPRPRPLPGENDPPPLPDLSRFDQPETPPEGPGGQQALFDPANPEAVRRLPSMLT